MWKLQPKERAVQLPLTPQSAADDHISEVLDESSGEDKSDETELDSSLSNRHCLPFKVLGTCHLPDSMNTYMNITGLYLLNSRKNRTMSMTKMPFNK